jgi:hypothetical protein
LGGVQVRLIRPSAGFLLMVNVPSLSDLAVSV